MSKTVVRAIAMVALSAGVVSTAVAGQFTPAARFGFLTHSQIDSSPPVVSAPEIDPASAVGGLTLLLGGLAVMRGRRAKK